MSGSRQQAWPSGFFLVLEVSHELSYPSLCPSSCGLGLGFPRGFHSLEPLGVWLPSVPALQRSAGLAWSALQTILPLALWKCCSWPAHSWVSPCFTRGFISEGFQASVDTRPGKPSEVWTTHFVLPEGNDVGRSIGQGYQSPAAE